MSVKNRRMGEDSGKASASAEAPRFSSFWPYSAIGLQDGDF